MGAWSRDRLQDRNTVDAPLGQIKERRRLSQGPADGGQGLRAQWDEFLFPFFSEDFNPDKITIHDVSPSQDLLLHLPGPVNRFAFPGGGLRRHPGQGLDAAC